MMACFRKKVIMVIKQVVLMHELNEIKCKNLGSEGKHLINRVHFHHLETLNTDFLCFKSN